MELSSRTNLIDRIRRTPTSFAFAVTVYLLYSIAFYYPNTAYVNFPIICKNAICQQAFSNAVGMVISIWDDGLDPNYIVNSPGCKILEMHPFDASVEKYLKKGKPQKCGPRITKLNNQKLSIDEKIMKAWKKEKVKNASCCYRSIDRIQQQPEKYNKDADWGIKYGKTCHHIPTDDFNKGIIVNDSFIKVECQGSGKSEEEVEFHGIALPPKVYSETTRKKAEYWDKRKSNDFFNPPSILVVGIDSTSRLHMIRSLPKTRTFLQRNDFVEMKGYTKVGPNTFPNIMAGFGGMELDNYTSCWPNDSVKLDDCPYIWKKYSDLNYITALLEDCPEIAIFNFQKRGFVLPPTDYYMRPLPVAIRQHAKRFPRYSKRATCVGGLSATEYQAQFINNFFQNMAKSYPYFLLSWFTSIGHGDFNGLKTADDTFHELFTAAMNKTSANPDNTIIIFMSDHGFRFGSFRETFLGFYEDSLPFFFFRLPPSLKARYPEWYSHLKRNSHELTSPLDLHSTFLHILNDVKSQIQNNSINPSTNSTSNLDSFTSDIAVYSEPSSPKFQARYSFFEYIPGNRSCESSSISQRFCMCGVNNEISRPSNLSSRLGNTVISNINDLLQSTINSGKCVKLKFKKFIYGREVGSGAVWNNFHKYIGYKDYLVALEASPSGAHFESKIRMLENSTNNVLGDITRINSYHGQSDCVADFRLKPYCFCKNRKKNHR